MKTGKALGLIIVLLVSMGSISAEAAYYYSTEWGNTGYLYSPAAAATDASGNVYVVETDTHRISKFSSDGSLLKTWGSRDSGDGEFYNPHGVAVDSAGNVYVADTYNHRIQNFTPAGEFLTAWGGLGSADGQFNYPSGIAVDSSGTIASCFFMPLS